MGLVTRVIDKEAQRETDIDLDNAKIQQVTHYISLRKSVRLMACKNAMNGFMIR